MHGSRTPRSRWRTVQPPVERERDSATAPIRDWLKVLPAQSRDQIKSLLRELAVEGWVQVIGGTRAGRWFATGKDGRIESAGDDDPNKLQQGIQ